MTKKWTPVRVGAGCVVVVALLGGCHAAKSRDAELVPFPQRVSIEEYTSRQLLEISSMAVIPRGIALLATPRWLRRCPLSGSRNW